jgi:hypothetical protein
LKLFWFNKRAISSVLSSILLTVIAVGAMSIAATATYVISGNYRDIMGERLIIEDVWFRPPNQIAIYIRNIGKVSIEVTSVYVNYTAQPFSKFRLEVGKGGYLNVTFNWSSGVLYHINIVTSRGTKLADYYKAP